MKTQSRTSVVLVFLQTLIFLGLAMMVYSVAKAADRPSQGLRMNTGGFPANNVSRHSCAGRGEPQPPEPILF